ncbi:MAG: hypothetical protein WDO18_22130 [Acidobacteriota bacterium]
MFKQIIAFVLCGLATLWGADQSKQQVPVEIAHDKGSFAGQLSIALSGSMNKARVEWSGTIRNTSANRIFRVTFCVKGYDPGRSANKTRRERLRFDAMGQQLATGSLPEFQR